MPFLLPFTPLQTPAALSATIQTPQRYTISFPDGQKRTLLLAETGGATRTLRLAETLARGVRYDSISAELGADGAPVKFSLTPAETVAWEARVVDRGGLLVRKAGRSGAIPLAAPLLTLPDAVLFLGKRIDWSRSDPQGFVRMLMRGEKPVFEAVVCQPDGREKITIGGKSIDARRLIFRVASDGPGPRECVLKIGPSGEVLQADAPFVGRPLRARALLPTNAAALRRLTTGDGQGFEVAPRPGGFVVRAIIDHRVRSTIETDATGRPMNFADSWSDRPFTASVAGGQVRWSIDTGDTATIDAPAGGMVWTPLHLAATRLWEKDEPLAAPIPVTLCLFGRTPTESATLERLPDVVRPNLPTLRRYRLTGATQRYELLTDGRQLICLRGLSGIAIIADGFDPATVEPLTWSTP